MYTHVLHSDARANAFFGASIVLFCLFLMNEILCVCCVNSNLITYLVDEKASFHALEILQMTQGFFQNHYQSVELQQLYVINNRLLHPFIEELQQLHISLEKHTVEFIECLLEQISTECCTSLTIHIELDTNIEIAQTQNVKLD